MAKLSKRVKPYPHIACIVFIVSGIASFGGWADDASPPAPPEQNPRGDGPQQPPAQPAASSSQPPKKSDSSLKALSLEELMNVQVLNIRVTTVSREESTVGQSPAAVFVITKEMIHRSGATTFPELFRMVPGMEVARVDNNKWAVGVRGFNDALADKLLVQVDGRTVYNPLYAGVYWDAVDYPLEDIDRIEVIRGPGASVWGANAVNGIINIITKSAKDTHGGRVSGGGGTQEQGFGEFRYGGKIGDNASYRVYGKGFIRDESFTHMGEPHDGWSGESAGTRFDWQASKEDAVTLQGDYLHGATGDLKSFQAKATAPFRVPVIEDEETNSGNILGRWSHQFDTDSATSLQVYWDHFDRESTNLLNVRWDTFDFDFQHNLKLGERNKFIYGVSYRFIDNFLGESKNDNGFALTFPERHRDRQVASAFLQDEISLIQDKLDLTLGSKFEHNDYTGFEIQPTARLLWTPTKRQSAWVSVSRAVRTPSLLEDQIKLNAATAAGVPVFTRLVGNTDLKSEVLIAYEAGYRVQATDKLNLDATVFNNIYDKLRGFQFDPAITEPPGTFIPLSPNNELRGETYGGELAVVYQPFKWWQLRGSYSYLKVNLHRATDSKAQRLILGLLEIGAEGQVPEHQLDMRSGWDLPHHVEFDLISRFVDRLDGFNPTGMPGAKDSIDKYFSLDARVGWKPRKNLELEVVGQNLLDKHHPETNAHPVEFRRSVYARITFRF